MSRSSLISVVILNYNGRHLLRRCLNSVFRSAYPLFEVIVVDNASQDGSVEYLREAYTHEKRLQIIQNSANLGFAEGNNIGAQAAKGNYIVFLNNDTEVDRLWLKESVKVFESDQRIGACQSKLLLMRNPRLLDCAGGLLDYLGFPRGRGDSVEDNGQYDEVEEIFHAKGAAIMVKRDLFEEVGLFDPSFFYYYEEIDLCWRIRLKGYKVVFAPKSIVYHSVGSSTAKHDASLKAFHATKNNIVMLIKNYNFRNMVKRIPIVLFLRLNESALLLLNKKRYVALAKFKALLWTLVNLKKIWKKRVRVQHLIRNVPDDNIISHMKNPSIQFLHNHFLFLYR